MCGFSWNQCSSWNFYSGRARRLLLLSIPTLKKNVAHYERRKKLKKKKRKKETVAHPKEEKTCRLSLARPLSAAQGPGASRVYQKEIFHATHAQWFKNKYLMVWVTAAPLVKGI